MNNYSDRHTYRRDDDYRNYRRRPTRRRRHYDDDYYDDDRDDYYIDERRSNYRPRGHHDRGYHSRGGRYRDADYFGTLMGLTFLAFIGLGIYWYNHNDSEKQVKATKMEITPDNRYGNSILGRDQTKENKHIPDDYDDYRKRVDDYD